MVRSSRVDQPPVSGVPVAGASGISDVSRSSRAQRGDCRNSKGVGLSGWGGGGQRTGWIQSVDINTQVYWLLPHPLPNLLDDPRRPDGVDFARLNNFEAAVSVIIVVGETR